MGVLASGSNEPQIKLKGSNSRLVIMLRQEAAAERFDQLIFMESVEEDDVGKPPKLAQARNARGMLANGKLDVGKPLQETSYNKRIRV